MLYHLLYPLNEYFSFFNVFRYITFRTIYAALTAFLLCFYLGPPVIRKLHQLQIGQYIRQDGPDGHHKKAGTPTMGGILIIFSIVSATLLWTNLTNYYIRIIVLQTVGFGIVGFLDDFLMLKKKRNKGLTVRCKFAFQFLK